MGCSEQRQCHMVNRKILKISRQYTGTVPNPTSENIFLGNSSCPEEKETQSFLVKLIGNGREQVYTFLIEQSRRWWEKLLSIFSFFIISQYKICNSGRFWVRVSGTTPGTLRHSQRMPTPLALSHRTKIWIHTIMQSHALLCIYKKKSSMSWKHFCLRFQSSIILTTFSLYQVSPDTF